MSSSLQTTFTADSRQLEDAYQRIARENVKLRESARQAADEAHHGHGQATQAAHQQAGAITGVLTQLGSMVSVYGTIKTAVMAVNDQIKAQIDLQKKAADAQSSMAMPRASLLQNLGGNVSPQEIAEVKQTIDLAAQKGYGQRDVLTTGYGELASATPTMTQKERQEAFMLAARYAPQPELAGVVASGIGDAMSLTGSRDPLENLGLIAATARESRSVTPQAVAQFMVPAAANIKANYGDSASESMALVLALQDASKDAEGRTSSTMAIEMATQAQEFTSAERVQDLTLKRLAAEKHVGPFGRHDEAFDDRLRVFLAKSGQGSISLGSTEDQIAYMEEHRELQDKFIASEQKRYGSDLKSTHARIALLQQNKQLGEEFLKDLHGEARPLGFAKQLIRNDPGAEVSQIYEKEIAGGIPTGEAAKAEARRAIANMEADPAIQARRSELAMSNTTQMMLEARQQDAEKARSREQAAQMLEASGVVGAKKWLMEKQYDVELARGNLEPAKQLLAAVGRRIEVLEDPGHLDSFGGRDVKRAPGRPATEEEMEMARILRQFLEGLDARIHAAMVQSARQHQETLVVARQNGARIQANKQRGTE